MELTNPIGWLTIHKFRQQRNELFALGFCEERQERIFVDFICIEQKLCFASGLDEEHLQCPRRTTACVGIAVECCCGLLGALDQFCPGSLCYGF